MQLPAENHFCSSVKRQDRSIDIYQVMCWSFICCVVTKRGKATMQISFQLLKRSMDKTAIVGFKNGKLLQMSKYLAKFLKVLLIIVKGCQKTLVISTFNWIQNILDSSICLLYNNFPIHFEQCLDQICLWIV